MEETNTKFDIYENNNNPTSTSNNDGNLNEYLSDTSTLGELSSEFIPPQLSSSDVSLNSSPMMPITPPATTLPDTTTSNPVIPQVTTADVKNDSPIFTAKALLTSNVNEISSSTISDIKTIQNTEPTKTYKPTTLTSSTRLSTIPTLTTTAATQIIDPALVGKCKLATNAINRSLFATNGELEDPDQYGFWLDTCGQTLLLGKSLGTWQQNSEVCFSLNMQPFALESKEKLDCMKREAKTWKYNLNYWTGGMKDLARCTLGWCSTKGVAPWQDVLPLVNLEKDQNCIQMQIFKTNGSILISDRRCSDKSIIACQGSTTKPPQCVSPVCPNVTCQKDATAVFHYS
ncbi:uncharacterized protein LOC132205197 [Neocloeon triangulifer]|uniref:uncharacterized protein LOC132205197 n=1 Tax=Neocloeon triangulifer TaxID=2078957 RepID=UPI00286F156A|nr:uncharacterized protein LOC132205197 [Neocloeon triangulifer]